MTKIRKIILAGAAVTAVAASSAFTAGILNFPVTKVTAYGETAITGATEESITYAYSPDKSTITSVVVVLTGDLDGGSGPVYTFQGIFSTSVPAIIENVAGSAGTGGANTAVTFTPLGTVSTASVAKFSVLVTTP
jgi:hypothetical protein